MPEGGRIGSLEEEDIYTPSDNLAVDADRARLPAMRMLRLENEELFSRFEDSTMRAIATLCTETLYLRRGLDPEGPMSDTIALELLDFMKAFFPEAQWTLTEDDGAPAHPHALLGMARRDPPIPAPARAESLIARLFEKATGSKRR